MILEKISLEHKIHSNLEIDGFKINYTIIGTGEPAIVIGSATYYPQTFSLPSLRMIFMDHRGFGQALQPFTNDSFELSKIINDIETLRQHLGLDKIIIIGHSGHGYMALEYAKKYAAHISKLILIAMSPDSSPESFAAANRYFQESVCPERKALLNNNLKQLETEIAKNPKNAFITRMLTFGPMIWYHYDYDATSLWQDIEVIPEMFDYVWSKIFRELDITQNINTLTCPVFLALGRYDYWNPPFLWEAVRSKFINLTIRVFEKSGHTPQLEEAEHFNREIQEWLNIKEIQCL